MILTPMVGLGLIYKAPYIQTTSWTEAYFDLKLVSQAEVGSQTTGAKVIFVQIQASSQVIPLPRVPTLFLDVKTPEDITDSKVPQPPQVFRGFQLFQITIKGGDPPSAEVAFPRIQGKTECSWISRQEQVLPPDLEEVPQITVPLSAADPHHWNIVNDPIFPDCLDNLHLQLMQEMGFIREIDQALSKSLMVEFLRLKVIIRDDLSGTLQTWQADMEAAMDKFLRDLDTATQTSTTLPSKNAAVGVALHQFQSATQLRVALPLARLDEAREEMEKFIQSHLKELRSPQEKRI